LRVDPAMVPEHFNPQGWISATIVMVLDILHPKGFTPIVSWLKENRYPQGEDG